MLFHILPFCLRDVLADLVEEDAHDHSPDIIRCLDNFIYLIRDMRDPIRTQEEVHGLQHRMCEWLLLADFLDIVCAQHVCTRSRRSGSAEPHAPPAYWSAFVDSVVRGNV